MRLPKFVVVAALLTTGVATDAQVGTTPGSGFTTIIGGGMRAGGTMSRLVLRSDFMLVQLGGDGEGWMSFRDVFEVKGAKVRDRDDRMLKLFQGNDKERFEKAARGRDLALTGHIWIDPFSGTVVKTDLNAADPAVRCAITVTFKRDEALDFWVPFQMDEYYKAALALDEIVATATYSNVRRFLKPAVD